jgi:hypothetical protein
VRRVGLDYHVDIDGHYYSVPHRLIREQLDARITAHMIELFRKGERVAVHLRGAGRGRHTTIAEHMPSSHRRYAEWTIERIGREAAAIGPSTAKLAALILESRPHPDKATALASASCGWRANTAPSGWRRPAIAVWISAPVPTARSNRSSSTGSIDGRLSRHAKASCCPTIPTSAAPAITNEEMSSC